MIRPAYMLVMLGALLAAILLVRDQQKHLALTRLEKWVLGLAAFCGATIGSKLPVVIMQGLSPWVWQNWLADGKTIMFGIVGAYAAVVGAKWLLGVKSSTGDTYALPVAVAISVGRLGCFVGGCCYGTVTSKPWGVHFASVDLDPSIMRHPIQLYEFAFHAMAALLIVWVRRRLPIWERRSIESGVANPPWQSQYLRGQLLKLYFISYFCFRFVSEFWRPEPDLVWGLSIYQLTALVSLIGFTGLYAWRINQIRDRVNRNVLS